MAIRNVIIEVRRKPEFEASLLGASLSGAQAIAADAAAHSIAGLTIDHGFAPIPIPSGMAPDPSLGTATGAAAATDVALDDNSDRVWLRGTLDESQADASVLAAGTDDCRVYADPAIDSCLTCGNSPANGTYQDVARQMGVAALHRAGRDGRGVLLAIVDTGISMAHLRSRGIEARLDESLSWTPPLQPGQAPMTPGQFSSNHGTMCAFDALIGAPAATLLDIAVLASRRRGSSLIDGLLSDAILGYSHLLRVMRRMGRPGGYHSLVVSNSWGMFSQSWDFPPDHPGNYSHNPRHPFNLIVGSLERAGADILFAAGNCGRECPDGRCGSAQDAGIFGANAHPSVLSVAGVDVGRQRVGYSTRGPGHIERRKPDIASYTHFAGSQVSPIDSGTSASTPVAAGLVAALRSRYPSSGRCSPARLREIIRMTADRVGQAEFDVDTGYGIPNGLKLDRFLSQLTANGAEPASGEAPADEAGRAEVSADESQKALQAALDDDAFMTALRAFGGPSGFTSPAAAATPTRPSSPCCPGCAGQHFSANLTQETMMSEVTDQEFMQALSAYMPSGSPAAAWASGASPGFDVPTTEGTEADDQTFLAALQAYGGPSAALAPAGMGGMAVDAAAALPSVAEVCRIWRSVSPIVSRVVPFLRVIPVVGTALAAALGTLSTLLNGVCSTGPTGAAALCQRWRSGLRTIVVRVASVVGGIPFIGSAARSAINALIAAIDTLCRGV